MELYFWLILGAILIVSLTILLARPDRTQVANEAGNLLEGVASEKLSQRDSENDISDINNEQTEEEIVEEKEIEVIIAETKKQWALSFAVFGLVFIMMGGIVLFMFDLDFTAFLGSCMIYVGLMALLKGISFQISKERIVINAAVPIITFSLNYLLLYGLLGAIGQSAWMMLTLERQIGDFVLVFILPYLLWRLVPTFGVQKEGKESDKNKPNFSDKIFQANLKFLIFTFILFLLVDTANIPVLRQYAKVGFDVSLKLLGFSLLLNILVSLLRRQDKTIERVEEKAARRTSVRSAVRGIEEEKESEEVIPYADEERQIRTKEMIKEQNKEN